jgi:hypothetical protein
VRELACTEEASPHITRQRRERPPSGLFIGSTFGQYFASTFLRVLRPRWHCLVHRFDTALTPFDFVLGDKCVDFLGIYRWRLIPALGQPCDRKPSLRRGKRTSTGSSPLRAQAIGRMSVASGPLRSTTHVGCLRWNWDLVCPLSVGHGTAGAPCRSETARRDAITFQARTSMGHVAWRWLE